MNLEKIALWPLKILSIECGIGGRKRWLILKMMSLFVARSGHRSTHLFGKRIKIDLRNDVDRSVYILGRCLERYFLRQPLAMLLKDCAANDSNQTFVDIGANSGMYSILAKSYGYSTVCVEPEPQHVDFLERNQAVFDVVCPVALGDESGKVKFFVSSDKSPGSSSLVPWEKDAEMTGNVPEYVDVGLSISFSVDLLDRKNATLHGLFTFDLLIFLFF